MTHLKVTPKQVSLTFLIELACKGIGMRKHYLHPVFFVTQTNNIMCCCCSITTTDISTWDLFWPLDHSFTNNSRDTTFVDLTCIFWVLSKSLLHGVTRVPRQDHHYYTHRTTGGGSRPQEILINFRTGLLPVQNLFSKHVFSDIWYRKVCVLKCGNSCFQIFHVKVILRVGHTWPCKIVLRVHF